MITNNRKEIEILRRGGKILAETLGLASGLIKPGVSAAVLNEAAEKHIKKRGGRPSFKNYSAGGEFPPFPAALCVSVNDEVVHGIPHKNKILREGDIVGLDLGVEYQGLYTDAAITVAVGKIARQDQKLIHAAQDSLNAALAVVKPGAHVGDIGFAIDNRAKQDNFSVVRELVGHGVGKSVHEDPEIPCFGQKNTGPELRVGMVLAIEPMVNAGKWKVSFGEDGWTVKTLDRSRSAHFEHTILVTDGGCEILTQK